ncbi:hypothetical protein NLI96_g4010 [Meripilus lineatus]|uniref:Uncharacterized protein n=1 Tax=Meripilus lineatus TaxID=2056292 RepID=A0AAD5V5F0_9APHY|nr:hypothetical protein NLI96_g4010 [Physisporinus lineatus]
MPSSATLFKYLSVALAAVVPVLGATPTIVTRTDGFPSINPVGIPLNSLTDPAIVARAPAPQTNAERFRRGLNPAKPRALTRRSLHARTSAAPCTPHTGIIKTSYLDSEENTVEGYVVKTFNAWGEYGITEVLDNALFVSFCAPSSPDEAFDMTILNGQLPIFPNFGFVAGWVNDGDLLGPGSFNYFFTSATTQSVDLVVGDNSFNSATGFSEKFRSTVWKLDPTTNQLTLKWINPDGTTVDATFGYVNDVNAAILATGDLAEVNIHFGSQYPAVTLTFEEFGYATR